MDIHKPKSWHSWREFLKEYGIIVLGVLTALAFEGAVEQIHWRYAVANARDALHEEIAGQSEYFQARLAVADCVEDHIGQVQELVERAAREGRKPAATNVAVHLGRGLDTGAWISEQAAQSIVHFPPSERQQYSVFYNDTDDLARWRNEEELLWDHIAVLDGPGRRVGEGELAMLRSDLSRARSLALLWRLNAQGQLHRAKALGVSWRRNDGLIRRLAKDCQSVRVNPAT